MIGAIIQVALTCFLCWAWNRAGYQAGLRAGWLVRGPVPAGTPIEPKAISPRTQAAALNTIRGYQPTGGPANPCPPPRKP